MRQGDVAAARAALGTAKGVAADPSDREASHVGFFDLVFAGRTDAAIAALYEHLTAWPRDALVVASAANPNGLIGGSGRIGQKHQIAALMDSLAPHYGDDFWFMAYHAMALSEDGHLATARAKIERSVGANPNNAHGAHGFAHVCYESGDLEAARTYLSSWLTTYPRDGFFYGHLSWHLSLCEIQPAIGQRRCGCIRTPSLSIDIAADHNRKSPMEQRFCGVLNSLAILATPRLGALYTAMRAAHCRGQAMGSPIYTSS